MRNYLFPFTNAYHDYQDNESMLSPKERLKGVWGLLKDIKESGKFLVNLQHRNILRSYARSLRSLIFDISGDSPNTLLADPFDWSFTIEPDVVQAQLQAYILMRCHRTLFKLREFDSDEQLRPLFDSPVLARHQNDLPEATSKAERIDRTIAYLLQKQLSCHDPVLLEFLARVLAWEPVVSGLRDELDLLHNQCALVLRVTQEETFRLGFANRETEKKSIRSFLIYHFYMLIQAPSGMGKTYLLREIQKEIEKFNWIPVWIDFASASHRPLRDNEAFFLQEFCQQAFGGEIFDLSDQKRALEEIGDKMTWMDSEIVIFLDHADYADSKLLEWLRDKFLFPFATEWVPVRVVTASQQLIPPWHTPNHEHAQTLTLSPLDSSAICSIISDVVTRFGSEAAKERKARQDEAWQSNLETMAEGLLKLSDGHPLSISLLLRHAAEQDGFVTPTYFIDHWAELSKECLVPVVEQHILSGIDDQSVRQAFRSLCIFRYLSPSLIRSLTEETDELDKAWQPFSTSSKHWRTWWAELKETHLIEQPSIHSISRISPVIRHLMGQVLHASDETRYHAHHQRARQEYSQLLASPTTLAPRHARYLLELFYHATQDASLTRVEATTFFKKRLNDFLNDLTAKQPSPPASARQEVHQPVAIPTLVAQRFLPSRYKVAQVVATEASQEPESLKVASQLLVCLREDSKLQEAINQLAGRELYDELIQTVDHWIKDQKGRE